MFSHIYLRYVQRYKLITNFSKQLSEIKLKTVKLTFRYQRPRVFDIVFEKMCNVTAHRVLLFFIPNQQLFDFQDPC